VKSVMRGKETLSLLRSLLFTDMLIYFYTSVCGAASLAGSLFDANGRWQHGCARVWSWLILKTSRIHLEIHGLENIKPNEPVIFCSNHPSAMDIPILFACLPVQFRFAAKRSLFHVPFLGWHLRRSGHIPVDRGHPRKAIRSLDQAAEKIRAGTPVVLFPEGHRSREGNMGAFKSGSFYLAIRAGVPLIPVTLNGSRAVLKPDTMHVKPGKVEVIIHPPVATANLTLHDVEKLSDEVREIILSRFKQGRPETAAGA